MSPAVHSPLVRLTASPPLSSGVADALYRRFSSTQNAAAFVTDHDVNASFMSLRLHADLSSLVCELGAAIGPQEAQGRAFRFELLHDDPAAAFPDDVLRTISVEIQGALQASVYLARRALPVSQWAAARPLPWGRNGLVLGGASPSLPFGGSASIGVAIETGTPTVVAKARLVGGLEMPQLQAIASAVGGVDSGFPDVAASPFVCRKGEGLLLELGDLKRAPFHRVLQVIEIEALRYGARLGAGALLSQAPLSMFTEALRARMGLPLQMNQIIETHLSSAAVS